MTKEKVAILIGSPYNILAKKSTLYNLIESKLNSKFKKISKYIYKIETENFLFNFYACYKPKRDKSYTSSKEYFKTKGEDTPPSTKEVLKKIKNPDKVFLFGTCGSLNGKKNQIYLPNEFYNISFKETYIKQKEIDEISLDRKIECKNILLNKVKGLKSKVITSNVTFIQGRIQDESKEHTIKLAKIMGEHVNCVDMESYPIVKKFRNKSPIGIFLFSSDVVGKHKKMNFRLREFQKKVSDAIKKIDRKEI